MIRDFCICICLALATAAIPLRAANRPHAGARVHQRVDTRPMNSIDTHATVLMAQF
jgi:hypothetical protein